MRIFGYAALGLWYTAVFLMTVPFIFAITFIDWKTALRVDALKHQIEQKLISLIQ